MNAPDICPACGAKVPEDAAACPECGADENTGWNEESCRLDGLDLPDDEFDHDEFVEKELGAGNGDANQWLIWVAFAGAVIILVMAILFRVLR